MGGSTAPTTAERLVRHAYAAFASGDLAALLAVLDPWVEWTEAEGGPYGGVYVGRQAVLEDVFARVGLEWIGFRVVPESCVAAGDRVAVVGTYRGVSAATGRRMTARFAHFWTVDEGRVVRFEQVVDSTTLNAALR